MRAQQGFHFRRAVAQFLENLRAVLTQPRRRTPDVSGRIGESDRYRRGDQLSLARVVVAPEEARLPQVAVLQQVLDAPHRAVGYVRRVENGLPFPRRFGLESLLDGGIHRVDVQG